jgi:hypothetical protein
MSCGNDTMGKGTTCKCGKMHALDHLTEAERARYLVEWTQARSCELTSKLNTDVLALDTGDPDVSMSTMLTVAVTILATAIRVVASLQALGQLRALLARRISQTEAERLPIWRAVHDRALAHAYKTSVESLAIVLGGTVYSAAPSAQAPSQERPS